MKPGYGRKQQQEQHILINNNVRVDGTLINNKVDFTFGNNQLNDNNISKVGTSKSFFRIDSTYGPKFFHYHRVNQIIIRRPLLTTHQKNHCVINARELLKHIEDCNNINDHAKKCHSVKLNNFTFEIYFSHHRYMEQEQNVHRK